MSVSNTVKPGINRPIGVHDFSAKTRKSVLGFIDSTSIEPEALADPRRRKSVSVSGSLRSKLVDGT